MAEPIIVGAEDLEKVVSLLREYTQKLRSLCEERATWRYRRMQVGMTAGMAMMGLLAMVYIFKFSFSQASPVTEKLLPMLVPLIAMLLGTFVVAYTSFGRRFATGAEAEQVAATLERLVKLASQYGEHARFRIGDRFEYELRLAEAEGALKTFSRIFGIQEPKSKFGREFELDPDFLTALRFVYDEQRNSGFRYLIEHICGPIDKAVPRLLKSLTFEDFIDDVGYKIVIREDVGIVKDGKPVSGMVGAMSFGIPSSTKQGWSKAEFLIQMDHTIVMNEQTKAYFDWLFRELKKHVGK
ncbi:MAG: hypothetical protein PCFJNLEI_01981 [Verrucomicrobiae bacterium]|nr:hypothetical protein [Verrucomicrobiae bacterium]